MTRVISWEGITRERVHEDAARNLASLPLTSALTNVDARRAPRTTALCESWAAVDGVMCVGTECAAL